MTYQIKGKHKLRCKECGSKEANTYFHKILLCELCYNYLKNGNKLKNVKKN
jgi:ribosomal protein L37AE/L43A